MVKNIKKKTIGFSIQIPQLVLKYEKILLIQELLMDFHREAIFIETKQLT